MEMQVLREAVLGQAADYRPEEIAREQARLQALGQQELNPVHRPSC
jgi:hypothetical protein